MFFDIKLYSERCSLFNVTISPSPNTTIDPSDCTIPVSNPPQHVDVSLSKCLRSDLSYPNGLISEVLWNSDECTADDDGCSSPDICIPSSLIETSKYLFLAFLISIKISLYADILVVEDGLFADLTNKYEGCDASNVDYLINNFLFCFESSVDMLNEGCFYWQDLEPQLDISFYIKDNFLGVNNSLGVDLLNETLITVYCLRSHSDDTQCNTSRNVEITLLNSELSKNKGGINIYFLFL